LNNLKELIRRRGAPPGAAVVHRTRGYWGISPHHLITDKMPESPSPQSRATPHRKQGRGAHILPDPDDVFGERKSYQYHSFHRTRLVKIPHL